MAFSNLVATIDRAVQVHLGSVTVSYAPECGEAISLSGMFDDRFVLADSGEFGVEQITPAIVVRLEDLPVHPDDDEPILTILGKEYKVRERQTDGVVGGSIRLLLHRSDL